MDITDALNSAQIAYHLDTRSQHRAPDTSTKGLNVEYVSADSSTETLEKVIALEPCPLLLVTASGRVLVLRSGTTGTIAVEGVDSANEAQTDILKLIGQAAWETLKGQLKDFYQPPSSGKKKPKAEGEPVAIPDEPEMETVEATPDSPDESSVDNSEPSE